MSIITNKNTTQAGMSQSGLTGAQSIRFVPASRVYMKTTLDSITAAPQQNYYTKSNGVTPTGWTDLGSMEGDAKLTYTKNTVKIKTGIDKVLQAIYVGEKDATIEFVLGQFGDEALGLASGLTGSVITAGSVVNFNVGQESVVEAALLCVYQNKLDGYEVQFYHPDAFLTFVVEETNGFLALKVTADLRLFKVSGQSLEQIIGMTFFA